MHGCREIADSTGRGERGEQGDSGTSDVDEVLANIAKGSGGRLSRQTRC